MLVNMFSNKAQQARDQWRLPRSLCVISVFVYLCVRPFFYMKASETEGWADKGDQRIGLQKTDKGTCHHFFNEQLDPISRGQQ